MAKKVARGNPFASTKPFFGFGWIETRHSHFWGLIVLLLLNPSSASAGLKLQLGLVHLIFPVTTKPFFGFGWIETSQIHKQPKNGK